MILYTGRTVKSTEFDYNYVGLENAIDQEGPGFYFSTSINTAFGYAGNDGIVIIADVDTTKFLTKKNKPKLSDIKKLILAAPDLEDTLTNFAEDYNKALKIAIQSYIEYYDSALDSYQTIWHDFYRYEPVKYLEQLIKLGYNGHFGELFEKSNFVEESQHVVVYNNKVIKVLDVKYSKGINESKNAINKILKESEEIVNEIAVHGLGYGLIHEIGDGSGKSFDFNLTQHSNVYAKYEFETDQNTEYKVAFVNDKLDNKNNQDIWELSFGNVKDAYGHKAMSTETDTNKGEQYKVMATIINIVKDFIKRYKNIDGIRFHGTDDRRNNMYAKYVSNHMGSNWEVGIDKEGNFILSPKEVSILEESYKMIKELIKKSKIKKGVN